jgi:hypothetical protein
LIPRSVWHCVWMKITGLVALNSQQTVVTSTNDLNFFTNRSRKTCYA